MWNWVSEIAGGVVGIVRDGLQGWRDDRRQQREANTRIAEAELSRDVAVIESQARQVEQGQANEHEWEMEAARQASRSWKDEYLTILLTIPAILCFVPGGAPYVAAGFAALDRAPDWYMLAFGAMCAFVFGIRHLVQRFPLRR